MSEKTLTLGSLFDGSGGFPLGGLLCGIRPVWASEIEPFAIRVTSKRLPFVKHYGDISEMNGEELPPVDIITFGSPCQDMSVAGKRSGLDGSRSCLFYEAIRIIKEMRRATNGECPRYIVWENVPGAFSSNGGQDFKAVLDSVIGIAEANAEVPMPDKNGWAYADTIVGDGWSVAYRVLDAQYWGVPQRRRRIYLVADFGGRSAARILFESEGVSGYSAESFRAWQRTANDTADCAGTPSYAFDGYNGAVADKTATLGINCGLSSGRNGIVLNDQGGNRLDVSEDISGTLRAEAHHPPCIMEREQSVFDNHGKDIRYIGPVQVAPTIAATYGTGGNNQPFVVKDEAVPKTLKIRSGCEGGGKGALVQDNKSATLSCNNDQTLFEPINWNGEKVSPTLTKQNAGGNQRMPDKDNFNCVLEPFGISAKDSNAMKSSNPKSGIYKAVTARTLDGNGGSPACNQGGIAIVCVDQGGGKSACGVSIEKAPTLACTHGGEPAVCIQGSMIGRKDENGPQGNGINDDVAFTLNATDRHAVYAMTTGSFQQVEEEKSPTLMARDFKDPNAVCYGIGRDAFNQGKNAQFKPSFSEERQPTLVAKGPGAVLEPEEAERESAKAEYTVRRLTPTECARLQGFPDWWCKDLGTQKPTDEEVYFWYKVFLTYARIMGEGKPKTDKQIRAWLKSPHSDSAEYKLWGNGVALPCVFFVLSGIVWANEQE